MIHNQHYNLYIASDTPDGGIYFYKTSGSGKPHFVQKADLERPQYMCICEKKLYVLLRDTEDNGSLVSFDTDDDGRLINQSEQMPTRGKVACHLLCDGGNIYAANYISGSVIKMPDRLVVHSGRSVHPTRQASPHTHFVSVTPDGKYIAVTDLGIDKIMVYDKELNFVSSADVPAGQGARHLAFSADGKNAFCANELGSSVSVFNYDNGSFSLKETVSTLFVENKNNFPSAIRFLNGYLYVANRGDDSISILKFDNKRLVLKNVVPCGGENPRDINIFGNILVCANQDSDNVTFYKIVNDSIDKIDYELKIKSAFCVAGGIGR